MMAWDKYPLELVFSSFFFAEIGAQLIFSTVSELSTTKLCKEAFHNVTVDESCHLAGTMSLLDNLVEDFPAEQNLMITRQMKHGFIFLSLLGVPIPAIHEINLEGEEVDIRKHEPLAMPF
jgi:hypothetical protein